MQGATVVYGLQPLAARLPELASSTGSTLCKGEYHSKFSTDHSSSER